MEIFVHCSLVVRLYQLQQLLQHGAISDSKPVACLLLSLASVYPSSQQVRASLDTSVIITSQSLFNTDNP